MNTGGEGQEKRHNYAGSGVHASDEQAVNTHPPSDVGGEQDERVHGLFTEGVNSENGIGKPDRGNGDTLSTVFTGFGQVPLSSSLPQGGLVTHVLNGLGYDEYVGRENRRHKLKESYFHNPFEIGKDGTREEVLAKYERHLYDVLLATEEGRRRLEDLRGKIIACWCAGKDGAPLLLSKDDPLHCHGQIVLRALWGAVVPPVEDEEEL
jgi:hypothetical protein